MQSECRGCTFKFAPDERERNKRVWCSGACRAAFGRSGVKRQTPHPRAEDIARRVEASDRVCACGHRTPNAKGPVLAECYECAEARMWHRCAMCGTEFRARAVNAKFCSQHCKNRAYANGRTRHQPPAAPRSYSRSEIFNRDRWVCAFCGTEVDQNAEWPEPLSPTIDHMLPVDQGGSDDPENLRTAHWACNRAGTAQIFEVDAMA